MKICPWTRWGNVVMNGYYSTIIDVEPEMKCSFKLNALSCTSTMKDMVQLAPIFENLKGNLPAWKYNGAGYTSMSPIGNYAGNGSLSTKDLSLRWQQSDRPDCRSSEETQIWRIWKWKTWHWTSPLKTKSGYTTVWQLGDYVMNLSGSTGLDQTIDCIP